VLPDRDVAAVRQFCEQRVAPELADQIRLEIVEEGGALTIVERRPPWRDDFGPEWSRSDIAKLRYVSKDGLWTLYSPDSNGRWHRYDEIGPAPAVGPLLEEVDRDPAGIFWG